MLSLWVTLASLASVTCASATSAASVISTTSAASTASVISTASVTSPASVISTASVTSPASVTSACPDNCWCGNGDELEYSCALRGANLTVSARPLDYVNIDCEGGSLSCSDFPPLAIAGGQPLPSLSIRACSLPDPLACVARRLGAAGVDRLMLKGILTPLEPRHVEGLGSTAVMMFEAGAQTSIPSDALSSLPSVTHFRLCGGNVTLSSGDFRRAPSLTYLELATDHITTLPARAFEGLDGLKILNFWKNDVVNISEEAFFGLSNLQQLYIASSRIRSVPAGLLAHTPRLKTVSFIRNELDELPAELFTGLLELEEVTISNDTPLSIPPQTFSNLSLTSLRLDRASLSLPPSLHNTPLVNLSLSHNNLSRLPELALPVLERLDVSYNRLTAVGGLGGLKSLMELNMDGNLIEVLPALLFAGLRRLSSVSISHNKLHSIDSSSFLGSSIRRLSLSHNSLSLSPPTSQYSNLEQYSPFHSLLRLERLDLRGNRIQIVFYDWKNVLLSLQELDLRGNSFQELMAADVQFLSSQIVVDLRDNNISTLLLFPGYAPSLSLSLSSPPPSPSPSAVILLADNPLACDCRLYEALRRLRGYRPLITEPRLDFSGTYCAAPPDLRGLSVPDVALTDLVCRAECACACEIHPYSDSLNLDCVNGTSIPDPRDYELSRVVLRLREMPKNFTLPDYVSVLNLSGIGLTTCPKNIPKSLEILDLSDNKLEDFPITLLDGNTSLKLSGNAFICDCSVVKEISKLNKHSDKIIDWETVKCKDGSLLWRLEVEKLCLVHRALVLGGVLAACGVLLALLVVGLHRYSLEIRIFLANRGFCFSHEYDATKKYDVFVSFAHRDEAFVIDKLLPKLEKEYRVCVHHRDWKVGDLIPAQIARSVEESRRTLIILSRNFLDSTWGMLEFRAAHVQAVKEKKVRVIVLLLEDLNDLEMDPELRAYLTTNTYIKWGDPIFWEKLRFALPKRTKAEDVRRERREKGVADTMARRGLHVTLNAEGKLVNTAHKG